MGQKMKNFLALKITNHKLQKIIKYFIIDIIATKTALLLGINRNRINHWYLNTKGLSF